METKYYSLRDLAPLTGYSYSGLTVIVGRSEFNKLVKRVRINGRARARAVAEEDVEEFRSLVSKYLHQHQDKKMYNAYFVFRQLMEMKTKKYRAEIAMANNSSDIDKRNKFITVNSEYNLLKERFLNLANTDIVAYVELILGVLLNANHAAELRDLAEMYPNFSDILKDLKFSRSKNNLDRAESLIRNFKVRLEKLNVRQ